MEEQSHVVRVAFGRIVGLGIAIVVAFAVLSLLFPQQSGILALGQIVLPHVVLAALLVGSLLAIGLRTMAVTLALVALLAVTLVRFGSDWVSLPVGSADGDRIALMTWNIEYGALPAAEAVAPILDHDSDVVALQELTPDIAAVLDADPSIRSRYPYRALAPDPGVQGLGILSAYPILDQSLMGAPDGISVTLDIGSGRRLRVMDTHPFHAEIRTVSLIPVDYDARERDAALATIRTRIDALIATDDPVVILGDFNTTPTEPGYGRVTLGLRDVHVEVGVGPGWTWRPNRFEDSGLALLRIDLALTSPDVGAVSSAVDCGHPGDHCILDVTVAVP